MRDGQLKVKIAAENRVNELINTHFPGILERAKGLIGRPIFKNGGTLRVDAQKILDLPTLDHPDSIYLNRSTYSLGFTFKTCVTAPNDEPHMSDHCSYAETTVYIADMVDGTIEAVNEFGEPRKTDYSFEEVKALQQAAADAKAAYDKARSACFPFGE